jgi:transcriptional regulator of acetoin/glycerol metabolism
MISDAIALGAAELDQATETPVSFRSAGQFEERECLIAACKANSWHAGRTATALGMARVTLYRRLKAAGVLLRTEKRVHRFRAERTTDQGVEKQ